MCHQTLHQGGPGPGRARPGQARERSTSGRVGPGQPIFHPGRAGPGLGPLVHGNHHGGGPSQAKKNTKKFHYDFSGPWSQIGPWAVLSRPNGTALLWYSRAEVLRPSRRYKKAKERFLKFGNANPGTPGFRAGRLGLGQASAGRVGSGQARPRKAKNLPIFVRVGPGRVRPIFCPGRVGPGQGHVTLGPGRVGPKSGLAPGPGRVAASLLY